MAPDKHRPFHVLGQGDQGGDENDCRPQGNLDDVGGKSKTQQSTDNGATGGNESNRQSEAEIGKVSLEQARPCCQSPCQGHQQPCPPDKVKVKWKETAHQRHIKHAAANTSQNRQDSQDKAEEKENNGPEPPGTLWTLYSRPFCCCPCGG